MTKTEILDFIEKTLEEPNNLDAETKDFLESVKKIIILLLGTDR